MRQSLISDANKKWQALMILAAVIISALKLSAWILTESNTILTDLAESLVHIAASSIGLYALILSSKPKDEKHPYGKGKIEYLAASIEGTLIIIAGLGIIIKAIHDFFVQRHVHDIDLGIVLIAGVGLINYFLGRFMVKRGEQYNAIILESHGKHLKTDAYSSVGLLVGLGLLYFYPSSMLDNSLAIIFGLIILVNGYLVLKKAVEGIMDKSDEALITNILEYLNKHRRESWIALHKFRLVKYGSDLHADAIFTLPHYFDVTRTKKELENLKKTANNYTGQHIEIFFEVQPCTPGHCKNCLMKNCEVRKEAFQEAVPLQSQEKHQKRNVN